MATASELIAAARAELGTTEQPPGSNRTPYAAAAGHLNGQPWCASFVVATARHVGLRLPSESAYTPTMAQGFKLARRWHTTPAPGDIAFFDFPDSKRRIQHVGIVVAASGHSVACIEGNTSADGGGSQDNGGGVHLRKRSRSLIVGFGRPDLDLEEDDVPKPTDIVDALLTPDGKGTWRLQRDGGVLTAGTAKMYGSYPGLPAAERQGRRSFVAIEPLSHGYLLIADDGNVYRFPKKAA